MFITLLLEEGGPEAVRYFLNKWPYPTESKVEAAHNRAVAKLCLSAEFEALPAHERLWALGTWLTPATHKEPRNARRLCEGFAEAEKAHREALQKAFRELPREAIETLRDDLRARYYFARALQREPRAIITAEAGEYLIVLWRESSPAWRAALYPRGARVKNPPEGALVTSPYYLWAGHLTSRKLAIYSKAHFDAEGRPVVPVVVSHDVHRWECGRPDCVLPAACEFFCAAGEWRATPWRERVDREEALLPPVGEYLARQGDIVFQAVELSSISPDAKYFDTPPTYMERHRVNNVIKWGITDWAYGKRVLFALARGPVRVEHPEHPTAVVAPPFAHEGEWALLVERAEGTTQYQRVRRLED
jgi:hypothetical protein